MWEVAAIIAVLSKNRTKIFHVLAGIFMGKFKQDGQDRQDEN
jgi:hypothetical protein